MTTERLPIAWTFVAALIPAATVGVFYFGMPALTVLITATTGCTALAALVRRRGGRGGAPQPDGRAALIGLLLGMSLPPASPVWMVVAGCAIAILLDKVLRGGLGFNPFNPALLACACLLLCFPVSMSTWSPPTGLFTAAPDGVTAASPLGAVKVELLTKGTALAARGVNLLDGLVGRLPGGVGETSAIALALGGLFLIWRGSIAWQIPVSFMGAVAMLAAGTAAVDPGRFPGAGFHLLTGGLVLGAFFMASDRATSPATARGQLLYGCGCGVLTWCIRSYSVYPEGVGFGILLMNALTPLIDLYTRPRIVEELTDQA
jgi:electron transport complex protein RnfD